MQVQGLCDYDARLRSTETVSFVLLSGGICALGNATAQMVEISFLGARLPHTGDWLEWDKISDSGSAILVSRQSELPPGAVVNVNGDRGRYCLSSRRIELPLARLRMDSGRVTGMPKGPYVVTSLTFRTSVQLLISEAVWTRDSWRANQRIWAERI